MKQSFHVNEYKREMSKRSSVVSARVAQIQRSKVFDPSKAILLTGDFSCHIKSDGKNKFESSIPFVLEKLPEGYYPKHKIDVILRNLTEVPGKVEKTENGWRVLCKVSKFGDSETWLNDPVNIAAIHAEDASPEYVKMREFVSKEGFFPTEKWMEFRQGSTVGVKFPYWIKSKFFEKVPGTQNCYVIQPGVPLLCPDVSAEVYLVIQDKEIDDPLDTRRPSEIPKGEKKRKIKVKTLNPAKSFICKEKDPQLLGGSSSSRMPQTEMLNERIPLFGHSFVNLEEVRAGRAVLPTTINLRVQDAFITPSLLWDEGVPGYTICRSRDQPLKDYYYKPDNSDDEYANVCIAGQVFQWTGAPSGASDPCFSFMARTGSKEKNAWRQYGFPTKRTYADAMVANPEIQVLMEMDVWPRYTLGKRLDEGNDYDSNDYEDGRFDGEDIHSEGLYQGGIRFFRVDYLRTFLSGGVAFEVSPAWAREDFNFYFQKGTDEVTGEEKELLVLKHSNNTPADWQNPLDGGIDNVVVPLGQGDGHRRKLRPASERLDIQKDALVAFQSTDAGSLFRNNNHRFFVITTYMPKPPAEETATPEKYREYEEEVERWRQEKQKWSQPGLIADDFVTGLIRDHGNWMRYFIFAMQKNPEMSKQWKVITDMPAVVEVGTKREKPESPSDVREAAAAAAAADVKAPESDQKKQRREPTPEVQEEEEADQEQMEVDEE